MSKYRVTGIRRDRAEPHCLIEAVEFAGRVHSVSEVMSWLEASPDNQLWVVDDRGQSVWVSARQHSRSGRYFLTTERDGHPLNRLASLPECRADGRSPFLFQQEPGRLAPIASLGVVDSLEDDRITQALRN